MASGKGAEPGKGGKKGKGGFGKPVSEQAVQLRLGLLFAIDVVPFHVRYRSLPHVIDIVKNNDV